MKFKERRAVDRRFVREMNGNLWIFLFLIFVLSVMAFTSVWTGLQEAKLAISHNIEVKRENNQEN